MNAAALMLVGAARLAFAETPPAASGPPDPRVARQFAENRLEDAFLAQVMTLSPDGRVLDGRGGTLSSGEVMRRLGDERLRQFERRRSRDGALGVATMALGGLVMAGGTVEFVRGWIDPEVIFDPSAADDDPSLRATGRALLAVGAVTVASGGIALGTTAAHRRNPSTWFDLDDLSVEIDIYNVGLERTWGLKASGAF